MLGVVAAALGPVALVGAAVGGGAFGGVIGSFFKKSFDLDETAVQEIGAQLDAGKVGVVVAVDEIEMAATAAQLANAGGTVQQFVVPAEALHEVAQTTDQQYDQGLQARRDDLDSAEMMGLGTLTPLI